MTGRGSRFHVRFIYGHRFTFDHCIVKHSTSVCTRTEPNWTIILVMLKSITVIVNATKKEPGSDGEPAFFQETKTLTYARRTSADMQRGNYQWLPGSGSDSLRMWEIPPRIVIPPLLLHCRKADRSGNNAAIKGPMVPPCYDYVSGRRSA